MRGMNIVGLFHGRDRAVEAADTRWRNGGAPNRKRWRQKRGGGSVGGAGGGDEDGAVHGADDDRQDENDADGDGQRAA